MVLRADIGATSVVDKSAQRIAFEALDYPFATVIYVAIGPEATQLDEVL